MTAIDFDPFDPRWFEDPYPAYQALRREAPAYKRANAQPRVWPHYWMLTRAADVNAALEDWRTFSSARGTLVDTDITLIPPNIFNMDPPRHDELRALLARVLAPARVASLEAGVREYARTLARELREKRRFDVATEFAQLIPTITMCELMDLPRSERERFLAWNLATLAGADFTSAAALAAYAEMADYWRALVAERRKRPGADLISQILHTEVRGAALTDAEIGGFCSLLHDAAQNTTMNMIANAVIALARNPAQLSKLAANPALWTSAVDELLRFISPVQGLARTATRDIEIAGVTIPEGDQVLLLYGSANHDEAVFENPDTLDFDRPSRFHWAFGHGIHTCLGASAARLEVRVALQELLSALGEFAVEERGIVRNQLVPTRGVAHAPVVVGVSR
ncbi:MAG: cytochrome P450 [Deltaproteobacteria bacterium]|nr:cytochrome P450 [Deltaproteobacteria bacterium]